MTKLHHTESQGPALNYCPQCGALLDDRFAFGRLRRYCSACDRVVFQEHKVAAAVLVTDCQDRVLLVRRAMNPQRGLWSLPAGFVDYGESPDYWLVEMSGLPFGLFGEMLHGGGNPWRGMVYGMTQRLPWSGDPRAVWKVWDDFGIGEARMIGYWAPSCPVKTGRDDVLATAYVKEGKTLIALASWAKTPVRCSLRFDWRALGLDPSKANLFAPAVAGFQPPALFQPTDQVPVNPGRGWLLIVDEAAHEIPKSAEVEKSKTLAFEERFGGDRLGTGWRAHVSKQAGTRLTVGDGALVIEAKANCAAYIERALPTGTTLVTCRIDTGTDAGASWGPGVSVAWPSGRFLRINLRAEGRLGVDDGRGQWFGGFSQPQTEYHLRIRVERTQVLAEFSADGRFWEPIHAVNRSDYAGDPATVRVGKMSNKGPNEDYHILGPPGECKIAALRAFVD